jgi:hypothetical protein
MTKALESPVGLVTLAPGAQVDAVITDDRSGKKVGTVVNTAMAVAGQEYTYAIPLEARGFSARLLLGIMSLRFAASGDYRTIYAGGSYDLEKISPDAGAITLYVKSSKPNDTLQVETWA